MQLDLVYASWFLAKFQNYRPIFGTGFGWFASSFNHLQQYSNSIISVLRCNAPNVLKISLFIFKTCKKLNKGFRYNRLWYIWHTPLWGGGAGQPHPPKLKSLISPLRSWDQCNFIHGCKLSILWKFEQDWTILRGVLAWSTISLYPCTCTPNTCILDLICIS